MFEIYRFYNFESFKTETFQFIKLQNNLCFGTYLILLCLILKASTETYGYQSADLKSVFDACFRRISGTETAGQKYVCGVMKTGRFSSRISSKTSVENGHTL